MVPTGIGITVTVLTDTGFAALTFSNKTPDEAESAVAPAVDVASQASTVTVRFRCRRADAEADSRRRAIKAVGNEVHILRYEMSEVLYI
jgi:hypothetical protein